jgi:hypothetical protein
MAEFTIAITGETRDQLALELSTQKQPNFLKHGVTK